MKKRVLILYISKYSGHYRAAKALESAFDSMNAGVEVTKINALDYTNPILGKVLNRTYLEIIKKKPELWGNIYDNPEVMKKTKKAMDALHRFNLSKMGKLIKKYSPDAVYCTQAFPCGMVADYKRTCTQDITLVGVLTDHAPHSYWLHEEVDHYVVPSLETASRLEAKGVGNNKIRVLGIPVDPLFKEKQDKNKVRLSLGLEPGRPTILIMGGSQGLGAIEEAVVSMMSDTIRNFQLIVVTGSNKKLFRKLEKIVHKSSFRGIKVLSYVNNVDVLMDASDVIVTKAGGMTTSEALVKGLPMVIVAPIPGQERMNTDHIVSKGAAIEVQNMTFLHEKLNELFGDPEKLKKMTGKAALISRPESALDAASLVLED